MRSGIDLAAFDPDVRPQDDLFRFVNGTWIDTTEIPADRARFGTFDVLREQSTARVRDLIEEAAAGHDGERPGTPQRQVGDLYASFMDTERVEELGLSPAPADASPRSPRSPTSTTPRRGARAPRPRRRRRAARPLRRARRPALARGLRRLPRAGRPRPARRVVLPRGEVRRDRARPTSPTSGGCSPSPASPTPAAKAQRIMALETRLAAAHWDNVTNRDAVKTYNAITSTRRRAGAPVPLGRLALGASARPRGPSTQVVVRQPDLVSARWRAALETAARGLARLAHLARRARAVRPTCRRRSSTRTSTSTAAPSPASPRTGSGGSAAVASSRRRRRGRRAALRRALVPARTPRSAWSAPRRQPRRGVPPDLSQVPWMSDETRARGPRQARPFTPKIGYPERGATTPPSRSRPDDLARQRAPRRSPSRSTASSPSSAGRSTATSGS